MVATCDVRYCYCGNHTPEHTARATDWMTIQFVHSCTLS